MTVAVIDSGVAPHPDLRNNLLPGTVTAQGESGDGQDDYSSHGTAMAGLIAAHSRGSNTGALGIAPKAKILPVRYSKPGVVGINDDLADGIEWAIERRARVISISAGGASSPRLRSAISSAIASDIVIVAAAGNQPDDLGVVFPAMLDGVVAVGATDRTGKRAAISVTGKQLDIAAPGVDIYSTSINGKYTKGTGTSDATAIVAGAVALVRSKYPELSAEEVIHRLTASALDKGKPGRDDEYGYGVLDLVAALTADVPPLKPTQAIPAPTSAETDAIALPDTSASTSNGINTVVFVIGALAVLTIGIVLIVFVLCLRRRTTTDGRG